jgi:hypothetical protein
MNVFIGYDPRQPVAYQVCAQSVWENASGPVSITRLDLSKLPMTRRGLTAFTYSRFLVPYLSGFEGRSLFLDSDILVRGDVYTMTQAFTEEGLYIVKGERKFEWPSVMLFSNWMFRQLTPEYVQNPANKLFDFGWAFNQHQLPKEYNHLVGYDAPNPDAKIVHFTMGIPVWPETKNCEFAKEWWDTCNRSNSTVSFHDLMGRSVHVPHIGALSR